MKKYQPLDLVNEIMDAKVNQATEKLIQQNTELLEALKNSKAVIEALISGKTIRNLDEAITWYDSIIKKYNP